MNGHLKRCYKYSLAAVLLASTTTLSRATDSYLPSATNEQVVQSDTKTISGVVLDEKGQPVIGATVRVLGTTRGTVTNINGAFELKNMKVGDRLEVSYVGYTKKSLTIGAKAKLKVTLNPDAQMIEEVVVVGYGSQRKENLTGAVSAVKFDKLATTPVANTTNMLQGRLPGVVLTNHGAQAGKDAPEIRIRGIGTFGNNNPMVLIDGVESPIGQISQLDPSDISSVSVLKDAASASIYGVRAANGVILITTKRGSNSKPVVTYSTSFALQQATVLPKFVDGYNWAKLWNEANPNKRYYTNEILETIKNGSDPDHFANTDWVGALFRTAPMYQHHLSVTGGTDIVHYMVSAQYFNQKGILKETGTQRINYRSNIDLNLNKFKLGLNLAGTRINIDQPNVGISGNNDGIVGRLTWFTRPTVPVKYSNGHWGVVDGTPQGASVFKNPVRDLYLGYRDEKKYNFDGKFFGSYEPIKGLVFSSSLAYKFELNTTKSFSPKDNVVYDAQGKALSVPGDNSASSSMWLSRGYINENLAKYDLVTDHHRLSLLAGHSFQDYTVSFLSGRKSSFATDTKYELDAGTAKPGTSGNSVGNAIQSFFGRVNYSYKDKYLVEMNLRYDGSSRLPKSHRYALFPSFSAGWVISNEDFMKNLSWLSMLKLRASYGTLGNQEIPNYEYQNLYATSGNYYFGNQKQIGLVSTKISNPDIRWETTAMTDLGFDMSLWNGRVSMTFDWYDKVTSDILMQLPLPATFTGTLQAPIQNAGKVRNRGWEYALNYQDSKGPWGWNAGFTLAAVKNTILEMQGVRQISDNGTINQEGDAIQSYYGLKALGLYRTEADLKRVNDKGKEVLQYGKAPKLGDIMYADINNDGNINDNDRVIIGNPFPKFQYSFNLGFSYEKFDVSTFWQGVAGIYRYSWEEPGISNGGNKTTRWLDRWTPDNVNGSMPSLSNPSINEKRSSFWLEKADYLRLKSLELGYTFVGKPFLKEAGISSLRLYLAGSNILTFTPYKNYDPEKLGGEIKNYVHPNVKSYSVGLNVEF